jgi:hypothetical protein
MSGFSDIFFAGFGGAIAGCFITLIAIIFSELLRHFLGRHLVRVKLGVGYFIGESEKQVFYEATNIKSQPVTLSSFGLLFKSKKWAKLKITPRRGNPLPFQLGAGNVFSYWSPIDELIVALGTAGKVPKDLHSVWFEASSGTLFRRKIDKWFINDLEEAIDGKARELYAAARSGLLLAIGRQQESVEKVDILFR